MEDLCFATTCTYEGVAARHLSVSCLIRYLNFNLREDSSNNAKFLLRITIASLYIGHIVRRVRKVAKSDY